MSLRSLRLVAYYLDNVLLLLQRRVILRVRSCGYYHLMVFEMCYVVVLVLMVFKNGMILVIY